MKHPIDPKIDCVFKALLGRRRNRRLLLHFLNAMLTTASASMTNGGCVLNGAMAMLGMSKLWITTEEALDDD
jgi:hypothetical protein